jgi:branched-chain amino acid transport system substrate-binding protein
MSVAVAAVLAVALSGCSSSGSGSGSKSTGAGGAQTGSGSSAASTGKATGFTGEPIRIGEEICQTGYLATVDGFLVAGAKIAVANLNAKGGILGHKVELITKDTQCVASNELQLFHQLVSQSHVNAVIGGYQSAAISGLAPVAKSASIPLVGAGTLPTDSDWGVTTFPPNENVPEAFIPYFVKNAGLKTLGNISGDTPFGQAVQTLVKGVATKHGVATKAAQISNAATDTTPVLQKMSGTQVIFTNTSGSINIIFSKNSASLGLKQPLVFDDGFADCYPAGAAYSNVYCVVFQSSLYPDIPDAAIKANEKALYGPYKASGGKDINFPSATVGADQINLIAEAMKKAGSTDGKKVHEALTNLSYTGAQSAYKFAPNHPFGVASNPYVLTKISKNNTAKVVYRPAESGS